MISKMRGAAIMITMFSLLLLSSLITISSMKTIKSNIVIVRQSIQSEQAFTAAEAGLDYGYAYIKNNYQDIIVDANENNGGGNGFIDAYTSSFLNDVNNGHNTGYDVSYVNSIVNNFNVIEITAKGSSDSGNVGQSIVEQVARVQFSTITPPASFITKGSVNLSGNVTITNTISDKTIWSGGAITLSGSASTLASNGISSDRNISNSDISINDSQLSSLSNDDFFTNMLGNDKATAESNADLILNYSDTQNISSVLENTDNNGKAIWINQTSGTAFLYGTTTIGSPEKPVFLIINGDFIVLGNTEFYGVIYVTQDWHNSGSGRLNVHGAVIVEGDFSGAGTPTIEYSQDVIDNTMSIAKFTKIPGSWHDF